MHSYEVSYQKLLL